MTTLKVFDKKNPERLLGELQLRSEPMTTNFNVAVVRDLMPTKYFSRVSPSSVPSFHYEKIELEQEWRTTTEAESRYRRTLTQEMILLTNTPLEVLMAHRDFRVAGIEHLNPRDFF